MRTKIKGKELIILFVVIILSPMAWAVDCPVPDTGQTKCYSTLYETICPRPGEDNYGLDANYNINPQSYTKLDANGNDLPDDASSWVMVRDNVTGLIWEVKTDDGSIHDTDNPNSYYYFKDKYLATLNSTRFGGYSDWRLPTVKELSFIRNLNRHSLAINMDYFPNMWRYTPSSSPSARNPDRIWGMYTRSGAVNATIPGGVWAVRGKRCGSTDNYIDHGNGTVTDMSTGLMWEVKTNDGGIRDKDFYTTQHLAIKYCEELSLAGHNDWRLPNVNELQSLVDYDYSQPAINIDFFPNTWGRGGATYWSSTVNDEDPEYGNRSAWWVDFSEGRVDVGNWDGTAHFRAVRGGRSGAGNSCFTKQIYGEYAEQTELLRSFRDNVLSQSHEGKELIKLYYQWSPVIVKAMEAEEEFKVEIRELVDEMLGLIK